MHLLPLRFLGVALTAGAFASASWSASPPLMEAEPEPSPPISFLRSGRMQSTADLRFLRLTKPANFS